MMETGKAEVTSQFYSIRSLNNDDLITVSLSDLCDLFAHKKSTEFSNSGSVKQTIGLQDCKMCKDHGITINSNEPCCVESYKYTKSFCVLTKNVRLVYPMPSVFSSKNFSFFKSHLATLRNFEIECEEVESTTSVTHVNDSLSEKREKLKHKKKIAMINKLYKRFMENDFQCGSFPILQSGKRSYVRTNLLGHRYYGARMTMIVDNTLRPGEVSVPKFIYNNMDPASHFMIINRDPSINDTSVYVCNCLYHTTDSCIHINPFILDGLHADQDGDDINVYYLKRETESSRSLMKTAISEMRMLSWDYGHRHNLFYAPRYSLGQQFTHLLYEHDKWFTENSDFYRELCKVFKGDRNKKIKAIMELGCSIMHNEVQDFVELILTFNTLNFDYCMRGIDYITCSEVVQDVVKSGSKGSQRHVDLYLKGLHEQFSADDMKVSFDDKIDSGKILEKEGQTQFSLLHALSPVGLMVGNLYYGECKIADHYADSQLFNSYKYNTTAIEYVFGMIMCNHKELVMCDQSVSNDFEIFKKTVRYIVTNATNEGYKKLFKKTQLQLWQLVCSRNPFLSSIDRLPLGLQFSIQLQSQKTQSVLNVKRLKDVSNTLRSETGTIDPITPAICIKWLYNPKIYTWYRVYISDKNSIGDVVKHFNCKYATLLDNVIELYMENQKGDVAFLEQLTKVVGHPKIDKLIFTSNCKGMRNLMVRRNISVQGFVDNLVNFLYCYYRNTIVVDASSPQSLLLYSFLALMFVYNKNLNNPTNSELIPPLHALSGESPQRVLMNYVKNKKNINVTTTSRERKIFDQMSDFMAGSSIEAKLTVYKSKHTNISEWNNSVDTTTATITVASDMSTVTATPLGKKRKENENDDGAESKKSKQQ